MNPAGLSVDVDSVACHLEGYGFERPADPGEAYEIAVPRALDLFDRIGARATFFLIAEEAGRRPAAVREIVGRGHEVASHSLTHALPLGAAGPLTLREEVTRSKRMLEDLSGGPVLGFRAPGWEGSAVLRRELAADGYFYDASAFPSIMLPALRWSVARRSPRARKIDVPGTVRGVVGKAEPHVEQTTKGPLVVIPVTTTPLLRLPYYHTMKLLLPPAVFAWIERAALRHRTTPTYAMHAVDFLDAKADGLDPRISRHPGMSLDLIAKLALAEHALKGLTNGRDVIPLGEIARRLRKEGVC